MIWFTSDLHFGHSAVIDYCKRPFGSLGEMHMSLIANWRAFVRPEDTVYVLGDMALCRFREFAPIAEQLTGNKILIRGNHDKFSEGQYNSVGFTVYHELKMKLAGRMVRLSHYPYALPWWMRPLAFKSELRFMDRRPPRVNGEILLHGHTHSKTQVKDNRIHVGVDAWGHHPVSAVMIERLMSRMSHD